MTQFFWNSYKRLEKELLSIAEVIHVSDDQLGVYSSKIGDLLVRTAIECEALSKELYHANMTRTCPLSHLDTTNSKL